MDLLETYRRAIEMYDDAANAAAQRYEKPSTYACSLCGGIWHGALGWKHKQTCKIAQAQRMAKRAIDMEKADMEAKQMAILI